MTKFIANVGRTCVRAFVKCPLVSYVYTTNVHHHLYICYMYLCITIRLTEHATHFTAGNFQANATERCVRDTKRIYIHTYEEYIISMKTHIFIIYSTRWWWQSSSVNKWSSKIIHWGGISYFIFIFFQSLNNASWRHDELFFL